MKNYILYSFILIFVLLLSGCNNEITSPTPKPIYNITAETTLAQTVKTTTESREEPAVPEKEIELRYNIDFEGIKNKGESRTPSNPPYNNMYFSPRSIITRDMKSGIIYNVDYELWEGDFRYEYELQYVNIY